MQSILSRTKSMLREEQLDVCMTTAGAALECAFAAGNDIGSFFFSNVDDFIQQREEIYSQFLNNKIFAYIALQTTESSLNHAFVAYCGNNKINIYQSYVNKYPFQKTHVLSPPAFFELLDDILVGRDPIAYKELFLSNAKGFRQSEYTMIYFHFVNLAAVRKN